MSNIDVYVAFEGDEAVVPRIIGVYEDRAAAEDAAEEIRDPDKHVQKVGVRRCALPLP